jgi:hypothetical protein
LDSAPDFTSQNQHHPARLGSKDILGISTLDYLHGASAKKEEESCFNVTQEVDISHSINNPVISHL